MHYRDLFDPDRYLDEFRRFAAGVERSGRNPLNTEMFFLWCMIRTLRPELFIESGTYRGYSATFICEALARNDNGAQFVTIGFNLDDCLKLARQRLRRYPFARVVEADSRRHLAAWPPERRRSAFFVDGPKGKNMPPLFAAIQQRFAKVLFLAVHDCQRESRSRNRRRVRQYFAPEFPLLFCGREFQTRYQELDRRLVGAAGGGWRPFFFDGAPRRSYGTETGYVLMLRAYRRPRIPRLLLGPYRRLRCGLLRGWV